MWVVLVLPPVIATVAVVALGISVWPRVNLLYLFFVACVAGLWLQVIGATRIGRTGATELELRRFDLERASGTAGVADVTDHLDAFARLTDDLPNRPASEQLPELTPRVHAVAAHLGLAKRPEVVLVRAGWGVVVSADVSSVAVSSAYLLVASVEEVDAELARQLAPHARPARLQALRAARIAATAGRWRPAGITSRLDVLFRPAAQIANAIDTAAVALASGLRSEADRIAEASYGVDVARIATVKAAVSPGLWRTHMSGHQRSWTASGSAVVPHEDWPRIWDSTVAAGQALYVDRSDLVDACTLLGWAADAPAPVRAPAAAGYSAFAALGGAAAPATVRELDDTAATQYYREPLNRVFGELGSLVLDDDEVPSGSLDGTPLPLEPDPRHPKPHLQLILDQIDVLELAMVRRDAHALAAARAIDAVAEAPTVRAMAAGVRWVCGDPSGLERISTVIREAPRGAGALVDLIAPLRAAGAHAEANAVQEAADELTAAIRSSYNLRHLLGLGPKLTEPVLPAGVRAALSELAGGYPKDIRAWFVEVDEGPRAGGRVRPAALFARQRFLTLRLKADPAAPTFEQLNAVWPATRLLEASDVEFVRRFQLRHRFERVA